MKPKQRTVHFYDLTIKSHTGQAINNPSCAPLADILAKLNPKGKDIVKNTQISLEVSDWVHDKKDDTFYILLNRADASLSDIALKDFNTNTRRQAGKKKHEGIEYSCHIIIRKTADPRICLMLMTMGSGVTTTAIEKFLNIFTRQLRMQKKAAPLFQFPHPSGGLDKDGKPLTYMVNYAFSTSGHTSALLDEVLKEGTFQSMELVAHEHSQFDSNGNLQITQQSIHVIPSTLKNVHAAALKNAVRSYIKTPQGAGFTQARISYKAADGSTKQNTFEVNNLDAAFTRRENVELDIEVEGQQTKLDDTILNAMRKLL